MKKNSIISMAKTVTNLAAKVHQTAVRVNDCLTQAFQALYSWLDRGTIQELAAYSRESRRVSDEQAVERYCRALHERRRQKNAPDIEF